MSETIVFFEYRHLWEGTRLEPYVTWLNKLSYDCLDSVPEQIDTLILDSEHTFECLSRETMLYEPRLKAGGMMFLHDTLVFPEIAPIVDALESTGRMHVMTLDTPRQYLGGHGGSGITIVLKNGCGDMPDFDKYRVGSRAREYFGPRTDSFARLVMRNSFGIAVTET